MNYRIWYSTESFADYIIMNTSLRDKNVIKNKMYESDANNSRNFHTMPDHIKQILYLDAPDLIVEIDMEPIFSIEISSEAGTGHNVFQRFARLVASVEKEVPSFYIYPEAVIINRKKGGTTKWDVINPLIFKALDDVMSIYGIPSLFYYFPSDYRTHADPNSSPNFNSHKGLKMDDQYLGCPDVRDSEMQHLFTCIDEIIEINERFGVVKGRSKLLANTIVRDRRSFMLQEFTLKNGNLNSSPLTATKKIPTEYILNYLRPFEKSGYKIGELLRSRKDSIVYQIDSKDFRSDPYTGCIAAIDHLICREGKTFEERKYNLITVWGEIEIDDINETIKITSSKGNSINLIVNSVKTSENRNLLGKNYMQMRYGSMFSKAKEVRIFAYFADAILFPDGALWRDA
jgi:hypothetical protein